MTAIPATESRRCVIELEFYAQLPTDEARADTYIERIRGDLLRSLRSDVPLGVYDESLRILSWDDVPEGEALAAPEATEADHLLVTLSWDFNPRHAHVNVFVGPERGRMALAGRLTFSHDEARTFRTTVRQGIIPPGFTGIFERGWHEDPVLSAPNRRD